VRLGRFGVVGQSTGGVRSHARRVALSATAIACAVYLGAAAVADVVVISHLRSNIDARLSIRLEALVRSVPPSGVPRLAAAAGNESPATVGSGDLDDAPLFSWWVPNGSRVAVPLQESDPQGAVIPPAAGPVAEETVRGHAFRVHQATLRRGRLVVATSVAQLAAVRTTLLILEGSLLPVILLLFFLVATVIGRGAATPIERARQEQLDFTADASHELRTPLAVIEAEIGLALSTSRVAVQYRESLERVATESARLRGIVDDLLWLARLDSLPSAPAHAVVDLAELVRIAAARFGPVAAARSVSLRAVLPGPEAPLVLAPADWLDRLVSVLVDNACRYSNDGGEIEVSASVVGERALLVVDDSGPGIEPAERGEVVRRFHRSSRAPGGAGLGLSIADTIVRATAGTWQIGRSPAGGARVEVSWSAQRDSR